MRMIAVIVALFAAAVTHLEGILASFFFARGGLLCLSDVNWDSQGLRLADVMEAREPHARTTWL